MKWKDWPRAIISALVMVLFALAYFNDPSDELMKGALITAFATVVNWWLGSSKGSSDKSDELARQATETKQVEIDQPEGDPVPVRHGREI